MATLQDAVNIEERSLCSCTSTCCNCCYICRREVFERLRAKAWGARPTSPMPHHRSEVRASTPSQLNISLGIPRTRRPATSTSRRSFNPSRKGPKVVRSTSAYGRLEMTTTEPRSPKKSPRYLQQDDTSTPGVKVATFCDWSDSLNDVGSTRLNSSCERPAFPQRHPNAARVAKMKQYYSTGIRMLSGRLFVKEKTSLTKGEREIITGIVQNRGDIQAEDALEDFSNPGGLQSHRDAWLLGKNYNRLSHPMIRGDDPYTCNCHFQGQRNDIGCMNCNPSKRYCQHCCVKSLKAQAQQRVPQQQTNSLDLNVLPVPMPPNSQSEEWAKKRKIPPINSSKGAVYVKNVMYENKEEPSNLQKRTVVDVYLPRLDAMAAGLNHEPPAPPSSPVQDLDHPSWWNKGCEHDERDPAEEYHVTSPHSLDLRSLRREIGMVDEGVQVVRPLT
ncbi:uncharacterized protein LOC135488308 [Lineus longissimus]|uniref:uncharacterized protein LOC135488308 n=1 Tax=Lineus longissimus TaxID=88925 RepID=UPI00315C5FE7